MIPAEIFSAVKSALSPAGRNHTGRQFLLFLITDPPKPLGFGALKPNPSGVFVLF
jgi:hypothetical protein